MVLFYPSAEYMEIWNVWFAWSEKGNFLCFPHGQLLRCCIDTEQNWEPCLRPLESSGTLLWGSVRNFVPSLFPQGNAMLCTHSLHSWSSLGLSRAWGCVQARFHIPPSPWAGVIPVVVCRARAGDHAVLPPSSRARVSASAQTSQLNAKAFKVRWVLLVSLVVGCFSPSLKPPNA